MPRAIATMEMRIIGFENEFPFPAIILLATNNSKFKG
jgi:hypothetical protein